jgi:hypothetical protein
MRAEQIAEAFDVLLDDAKLALRIMRYKVNPVDMPDKFPNTLNTYRHLAGQIECCAGTDNECRMSALNELLLTHGVEAIRTSEHIDRYHFDIRASYLNTGDTYNTTILLDHRDSKWLLTSWGDFVESLEGKKAMDTGELIEVY